MVHVLSGSREFHRKPGHHPVLSQEPFGWDLFASQKFLNARLFAFEIFLGQKFEPEVFAFENFRAGFFLLQNFLAGNFLINSYAMNDDDAE